MSALAFFDNVTVKTRTALWTKLMKKHGAELEAGFTTATYNNEDPTIERVYLAALRAAPDKDKADYRKKFLKRADEFIERNSKLAALMGEDAGLAYPYVSRFGMIIQAILAQQGQFPAELPKVPLDGNKAP